MAVNLEVGFFIGKYILYLLYEIFFVCFKKITFSNRLYFFELHYDVIGDVSKFDISFMLILDMRPFLFVKQMLLIATLIVVVT